MSRDNVSKQQVHYKRRLQSDLGKGVSYNRGAWPVSGSEIPAPRPWVWTLGLSPSALHAPPPGPPLQPVLLRCVSPAVNVRTGASSSPPPPPPSPQPINQQIWPPKYFWNPAPAPSSSRPPVPLIRSSTLPLFLATSLSHALPP